MQKNIKKTHRRYVEKAITTSGSTIVTKQTEMSMTMTPLSTSDGTTWYARLREQLPSGSGGTFRWRKLAEGELSVCLSTEWRDV